MTGRTLLLRAKSVESCGTIPSEPTWRELNPLKIKEVPHAPPLAKLAVRTHEVQMVDSYIMITESDEAPNPPSDLTPEGHV